MAFFGIMLLGPLLVGLLLGILFVPRILRYFLAELGEAARANPKEKIQYSILDIYILIGQIALYSLPAALGTQDKVGLPASMLITSVYYLFCWSLAVRLLSRTHIRAFWPRFAMLMLYPWMVTVSLYFGIGSLLLLFLAFVETLAFVIALGAFMIAALIFRAVSRWALSKRERPETLMSSAKYAGGYAAPVTTGITASAQNTDKFASNAGMDDDLKLQ